MCICEKCACRLDKSCAYYESYVKSNLAAATEYSANRQFGGEYDPYLEAITKANEELTCEYCEEI